MSSDSSTAALPAWEQFLENNFKKIVLLFLAAVAAMTIYGISRYLGHAAEVKAGEAFAAAKTVEDLDVVIAQHKTSLAAGNALLKKAELLWEQNKKTTSVDALKAFVTDHPKHPLLAQALLALGTKQEALGQKGEAKQSFERITGEFAQTELAPLAELRLGDLAWAEGKEDDAKKIYEGLPTRFTGMDAANPFLSQSESRLEWISAKLPTKEVDGPPKPKVDEKKSGAPAPGAPVIKLGSEDRSPLAPTLAPQQATNSAPPSLTLPAAMPAPAAPANPAPVTLPVPTPTEASAPKAPAPAESKSAPTSSPPAPATAPSPEKPAEPAPAKAP